MFCCLLFILAGGNLICIATKIQQSKMLVTCQRFGDLFLFGLFWQYSSNHKTYNKGRFKVIATYLLAAVINFEPTYIQGFINLFTTSEPPKYSNSNSPNLLLWSFCLIKSRANCSGIKKPFLNPNLIFFSKAPQIVCRRIIKKNQNKDLENSNILEVPMSRTSYWLSSLSW